VVVPARWPKRYIRDMTVLLIDRITVDPEICDGKPVIRGMRITAQTVLEYLSAGETQEEILRHFPMLEPEDISACLAFASRLMGHRYTVKEIA
jgi:uncharacterized protein (DUF433 family)